MDWFVSVREEESGAHLYRGGAAPDRATVLEQVVHAGREIAHREDGSVIAVAGEVVIDGTPVDANAFGRPRSQRRDTSLRDRGRGLTESDPTPVCGQRCVDHRVGASQK